MKDPYLWRAWLGYKYRMGADPRYTKYCCCLKLVQAVYEELDLGKIPFNDDWYTLSLNKQNETLFRILQSNTEELAEPRLWSIIALLSSRGLGLGLIVQDKQVLIPYHYGGLMAISNRTLPLEARRFYKPLCF